jgi:hypothetical protein
LLWVPLCFLLAFALLCFTTVSLNSLILELGTLCFPNAPPSDPNVTTSPKGNEKLRDPPPEIVALGAKGVVKHCHELYLSDTQLQMRNIIRATQKVLNLVTGRASGNLNPDFTLTQNLTLFLTLTLT